MAYIESTAGQSSISNLEVCFCMVNQTSVNPKEILLEFSKLSELDKITYKEYVNRFASDLSLTISGSVSEFTSFRSTYKVVSSQNVEIEYESLTISEKSIIDNFYQLLNQNIK